MNDPAPTQLQNLQSIQAITQLADAMSLSLLFSLGRQYLEVPFAQASFLQSVASGAMLAEQPHFLRLEQIGESPFGSPHQPFTALQTALSACHDPGRYSLLFVVVSDGQENRVYLGVRGRDATAQPYAFVDYLGHFLEGNWPGTRLRRCEHQQEILPRILYPLGRRLRHAVALTGVPSLKPGDHPGYPQSLDRLLRGLRGRPFMYVVVAEPMAQTHVNQVILQCRNLIGRVHALTKINLTETLTQGTTQTQGQTVSYSEGKTTSFSHTQGFSETETQSWTREDKAGRLPRMGKELGIAALGGVASGILSFFLGPAAGLLGLLGTDMISETFTDKTRPTVSKSTAASRNESVTRGESASVTYGTSDSLSTAVNLSAAQAIGKEYFNAHAKAAEEHLSRYIARFEQARALGCWNVGVYFLAEEVDTALQGGAQLRALLSGEKSAFEPLRAHDLARVWTSGAHSAQTALSELEQPPIALVHPQTGEPLDHPLGAAFTRLTTPLNTEELALLVNLPQREVPSVQVMPTAGFSLNPPVVQGKAITLGPLLAGGEPTPLQYALPLNALTKHALVTGITGSGKSTTCLRLLHELQQQRIPFLVIEPAKDEYVAWALQQNITRPPEQRIRVYVPGVATWRGQALEHTLRLNPLDVVWLDEKHPPPVLSHVDRLKSILNATFPMQEALPILLEEVLFAVYSKPVHWLGDELPPFGSPRPTLRQMYDSVREVVKQKGYEERVTANLTAALMTRLNSLRRGWKGRLFDRPDSTPWPEIFDQPAVINLAQLGDDADRAFAMAVLLQFLYEYRQAQAESAATTDSRLRHLTVIEEAHRVLLRTAGGGLEQANPQGKVAEMFSNILSEIRAYGEGLLIVDQVPARLIPDAIKNTNLKIVHRLVASDDREAMGGCMTLTPDQTALINRLRSGQAIVYGDQDDMAAWVQVAQDSAN